MHVFWKFIVINSTDGFHVKDNHDDNTNDENNDENHDFEQVEGAFRYARGALPVRLKSWEKRSALGDAEGLKPKLMKNCGLEQ